MPQKRQKEPNRFIPNGFNFQIPNNQPQRIFKSHHSINSSNNDHHHHHNVNGEEHSPVKKEISII
ncbi:hypothetical protein TVAG_110310 [Trichomonas vaginalis G3]|uniref:Uncharacterized protein n=1 Tax=Trichomonas vaginalis (strain ATCC PRA-98 / G3) TaxID=412133 RepID=A2DGN2_TRIV3|nr:hypothetical protein TVAG_110310 [Trichomonas vaginalis G3]|eukprot:XP_001581405.1 hypothetical protein [Trichomonas vaginalis G3]